MSSYYYIRALILLYMCPHTAMYVSSYCYMCPHTVCMCPQTTICVLILLYRGHHTTTCVLILLYMCPYTAIYVSSYYYMCPHTTFCPHTTIYVSSYYYICVVSLAFLQGTHVRLGRKSLYVSSYYHIGVLILLYMCPQSGFPPRNARAPRP